jgi:hypothetical protein
MCFGCILIAIAATFPRLGLLIIWIFTDWIQQTFTSWVWPLLGLIFLPFTTMLYVMVDVSSRGNITFGGWLLVILGAILDLAHWGQVITNRENAQTIYTQYAPGS